MLDSLTQDIPAAMQGFIGQIDNLKQIDTYLATQVFETNLPIVLSVMAILLAVGLTIGEEDKGQLRTLISLPLSRRKIVAGKWLAMLVVALGAALANTAGIYLALWQIGESADSMALFYMTLMTWLLMVALATIIFAIGIATGSRAVTLVIGVVLVVGSYLLTIFSQGVEWLRAYEGLSLLHYFPATDIAQGTVEIGNFLVYAGLIVAALVATLVIFPRRDIKS
jgi:ABC-2 type transport system permease protein